MAQRRSGGRVRTRSRNGRLHRDRRWRSRCATAHLAPRHQGPPGRPARRPRDRGSTLRRPPGSASPRPSGCDPAPSRSQSAPPAATAGGGLRLPPARSAEPAGMTCCRVPLRSSPPEGAGGCTSPRHGGYNRPSFGCCGRPRQALGKRLPWPRVAYPRHYLLAGAVPVAGLAGPVPLCCGHARARTAQLVFCRSHTCPV